MNLKYSYEDNNSIKNVIKAIVIVVVMLSIPFRGLKIVAMFPFLLVPFIGIAILLIIEKIKVMKYEEIKRIGNCEKGLLFGVTFHDGNGRRDNKSNLFYSRRYTMPKFILSIYYNNEVYKINDIQGNDAFFFLNERKERLKQKPLALDVYKYKEKIYFDLSSIDVESIEDIDREKIEYDRKIVYNSLINEINNNQKIAIMLIILICIVIIFMIVSKLFGLNIL